MDRSGVMEQCGYVRMPIAIAGRWKTGFGKLGEIFVLRFRVDQRVLEVRDLPDAIALDHSKRTAYLRRRHPRITRVGRRSEMHCRNGHRDGGRDRSDCGGFDAHALLGKHALVNRSVALEYSVLSAPIMAHHAYP